MQIKKTSIWIVLITNSILFALPAKGQTRPEWNGYAQIRLSDQFQKTAGFSIRRAKLWIDGPAPLIDSLFYRVQGIFRYQTSGTFMLQDVYAEYRLPFGFIRGGQFVPDFSLERAEGDAYLPLVERANVVNTLIPSGNTYARDIGAEFVVQPPRSGFHISAGIYNGNGGNTKSNEDMRFLYTNRTTYNFHFTDSFSWENGFSLAYRNKSGLKFPAILGKDSSFSGSDFRWGVETHMVADKWEIQSEYIRAYLNQRIAYGYYAFADYDLTPKNQIVLSIEKLNVPNPDSLSQPWYIAGYSHFFNGQKIKIMTDAGAQFVNDDVVNYSAVIQFQIFFR
jgi:hypothetical protein